MAEPINSISNFVIIFFGLLAFYWIWQSSARRRVDLYLLAGLLLATGIGSWFWHTFRTPTSLSFDFIPGILFLLTFVLFWARGLFGLVKGFFGLLALVAVIFVTGQITQNIEFRGAFFLPVFLGVTVYCLIMVYLTWKKAGPKAARTAGLVSMLAFAAAFFRTIDLYTCEIIPFGTHFLWHIFLSSSAFLGVSFLISLGRINGENFGKSRF